MNLRSAKYLLAFSVLASLLTGQCWEGAPRALPAKGGFTAEAAVFEVDGQLARYASLGLFYGISSIIVLLLNCLFLGIFSDGDPKNIYLLEVHVL
jgi:hypothetical protein